jgi:hypothetical protein
MTAKTDLDPAAIAHRLRQVADLRKRRLARSLQVDYSREALSRRLLTVARMRRLCIDLAIAGRVVQLPGGNPR